MPNINGSGSATGRFCSAIVQTGPAVFTVTYTDTAGADQTEDFAIPNGPFEVVLQNDDGGITPFTSVVQTSGLVTYTRAT